VRGGSPLTSSPGRMMRTHSKIRWPRGVTLSMFGIVSLAVTGCVSLMATPAQDLAETRWKACNHFATVRLGRIQLNGHVYATADLPEIAAFRQCMEAAAADEIRNGALAADPGVTVDPPPGQE